MLRTLCAFKNIRWTGSALYQGSTLPIPPLAPTICKGHCKTSQLQASKTGLPSTHSTTLYDTPNMYEKVFVDEDLEGQVAFLLDVYQQAVPGRSLPAVCELGCGPANHSITLSERGCRVTALDVNEAMLEHARKKAGDLHRIAWLHGDMRTFTLPERVDMMICMTGTFTHMLTNDDAAQCLQRVAEGLHPGGLFVIEMAHPADFYDGSWIGGDEWGVREGRNTLFVTYGAEDDTFDPVTQVLARSVLVEREFGQGGERETVFTETVHQRMFTVQEMNVLAQAAGLTTYARYGAMDADVPLDDDEAVRHVLVLQKPAQG